MIQIETAVWPLRRSEVTLPVTSFIAEALNYPPEIPSIGCVSIPEIAADKLVALTRRAGAEMAGLAEADPTLVRHIHDLHALRRHYEAGEVVELAREVMQADAEAYGNQFPAYRATRWERPCAQSRGSEARPNMPGATRNSAVSWYMARQEATGTPLNV